MDSASIVKKDTEPHVAAVAAAGLVALALAIGVGRFAFTPILPMMEGDAGLSLTAAGWLASANYLGYVIGALFAARLSLSQAMRGGLVLIAVVTFAMGLTHILALQVLLRLVAGIASAWVLVHVSSWTLGHLLTYKRADLNGVVYAGTGAGIAAAGLVVMGVMQANWNSDETWELLGVLSLVITLLLWRSFRGNDELQNPNGRKSTRIHWTADKCRLVACYGALGFGYIIPATYLSAMAHRYITSPLLFGLAWPVFGIASALSTLIAARWLAHVNDRKLWAFCYGLMIAGVVLPALWPGLTTILISALLVGGTYMVITMLGLREGRRVGVAEATSFIALMTATFGVGQIVGPLLVSAVAKEPHGFAIALLSAAAVLTLAAVSLWRSAGHKSP